MSDDPVQGEVIRAVPEIGDLVEQYPMTFAGDALQLIDTLTHELRNVSTREDVVMRGLGLLQAARKKDLVLKDPATGASEVVRLWK